MDTLEVNEDLASVTGKQKILQERIIWASIIAGLTSPFWAIGIATEVALGINDALLNNEFESIVEMQSKFPFAVGLLVFLMASLGLAYLVHFVVWAVSYRHLQFTMRTDYSVSIENGLFIKPIFDPEGKCKFSPRIPRISTLIFITTMLSLWPLKQCCLTIHV